MTNQQGMIVTVMHTPFRILSRGRMLMKSECYIICMLIWCSRTVQLMVTWRTDLNQKISFRNITFFKQLLESDYNHHAVLWCSLFLWTIKCFGKFSDTYQWRFSLSENSILCSTFYTHLASFFLVILRASSIINKPGRLLSRNRGITNKCLNTLRTWMQQNKAEHQFVGTKILLNTALLPQGKSLENTLIVSHTFLKDCGSMPSVNTLFSEFGLENPTRSHTVFYFIST